MRAIVAGTITFPSTACPPKVLECLKRELSFPNPIYLSCRRMGRRVKGIPERIECLVERDDGWVELPRGAVLLLRKRLQEGGLSVEFEDRRCSHPAVGLRAKVELRPYQVNVIERMRSGVQGFVVLPCGGGKSIIGTAALAVLDQPTLILVHTLDLLQQWHNTITLIYGFEPGVVTEGCCAPSAITLATVQSLVRLPPVKLDTLAARFGCVLVDEAQHTPASTFQQVLSRLPAKYRFGLTATPYREDGLTPLLSFTLGELLWETTTAQLVAQGFLQIPAVRPIFTDFSSDSQDYHACMKELIEDPERNELIAGLATREAREGHSVLVLSGRVKHCRKLVRMIREVPCEVLVGDVKKLDRQKILNNLRSGMLRVVVASTLADEGLDIPRLDRIILAYPGRTRGRTAQRLGRLMRPHPDKQEAILYDLVDLSVPSLARQYQERRRIYRQLTT